MNIDLLYKKIIQSISDIIFSEDFDKHNINDFYERHKSIENEHWCADVNKEFEYVIDNVIYTVNVTFDISGCTKTYKGDYYTPDYSVNVLSINNVSGSIYGIDKFTHDEIIDMEFTEEFNKKLEKYFQNVEF